MKLKTKKEISGKNLKELSKMLEDTRSELLDLNLDKQQNKLKNTRAIFWKRKEIAVILTTINKKELMEKEGEVK